MSSEHASTAASRRRGLHPAGWLFVIVLLAEFIVFDAFGSKRHTAVYPRWNDQVQYLGEAYTAFEYSREHGLPGALWQSLINPSAQGTLHDFGALVLFAFAGPSRSAALALNMLALIAWQAALFGAVGRRTGSRWLGLAVAMLPLALAGPWENSPGSAYDFRLDHLAMCALGVASAAAVLADDFRSRRGAIGFGVAVGATLLTRFLTGTYFVVIFAGALAWIIFEHYRRTAVFPGSAGVPPAMDRDGNGGRRSTTARLINLGLAALVAAVVAAPFFWLNREWVWNYYYIGHYVGQESTIRDPHLGLGRSIAFVASALFRSHVGAFFCVIATLGAIALALGRGGSGRSEARRRQSQTSEFLQEQTEETETAAVCAEPAPFSPLAPVRWFGFRVGGLFLLAPALVLTLHRQKSEVVVSALVPGVVLLVAAVWAAIGQERREGNRSPMSGAEPLAEQRPLAGARGYSWRFSLAAAAIAAGCFGFFAERQLRPAYDAATLANFRQVNALADHVFTRARAAGIERAHIAADNITDCLDGQVLRVICYERHGVWMPFEMSLPISIAEPTTVEVMERLAASHFVFLADDNAPVGPYPYDRKLASLRPQLREWCSAHLQPALEFDLWGQHGVLYQRQEIR
ncbi:MAG: hypothetical protein Q7S40_25630 [Opitutaceae bacterium]|nr:hypothetical protein [Opitutaceae bacterium]